MKKIVKIQTVAATGAISGAEVVNNVSHAEYGSEPEYTAEVTIENKTKVINEYVSVEPDYEPAASITRILQANKWLIDRIYKQNGLEEQMYLDMYIKAKIASEAFRKEQTL